MKKVDFSSIEEIKFPSILKNYFSGLKLAIMDIETTGLSPNRSEVIIGGYAFPVYDDNERIETIQYFAEKIEDEKDLLKNFIEDLNEFDIIITYNGNRFDIPFLQRRLEYHNLPSLQLSKCQSLDLYQVLNKYSLLRKFLPNLKQKTVETYMNLWRTRYDEISGAESVEMYYNYLHTHDEKLEKTILLHNKDDLLQLTRLLKVIEKIDFHQVMFYNGFIIANHGRKVYIENIKKELRQLIITGSTSNLTLDYKGFNELYKADFYSKTNSFIISIPLNHSVQISDYEKVNKGIQKIIEEILIQL